VVVLVATTGDGQAPEQSPLAGAADPWGPESTGASFPSPILHMYVSTVLGVSNVCCICFIWMLQK
jgi:hypothetical protein